MLQLQGHLLILMMKYQTSLFTGFLHTSSEKLHAHFLIPLLYNVSRSQHFLLLHSVFFASACLSETFLKCTVFV